MKNLYTKETERSYNSKIENVYYGNFFNNNKKRKGVVDNILYGDFPLKSPTKIKVKKNRKHLYLVGEIK